MFIERFLIFIIFLGPLVFFHELGHFLFARLFGVRVEVFSIGFGPKLFRFKKGDTEYAISLIPLGGYVKMFGDDPLKKEEIPEEERALSFTHKSKWARFWIVLGGPLANFLMAFCIFFFLAFAGEKAPEIKIGAITPENPLSQTKLMSGDILTKVNKKEVFTASDIIIEGNNYIDTLSVKRFGEEKTFTINMNGEDFFQLLAKTNPILRKAILLDNFGKQFVVSLDQYKPSLNYSLESLFHFKGDHEVFVYQLLAEEKLGSLAISFRANLENRHSLLLELRNRGYYAHDLKVRSVNMKSPADKAGIKANDIVVAINEKPILNFDDLRKELQAFNSNDVEVSYLRDGQVHQAKITAEVKEIGGKHIKLLGIYSGGIFEGPQFIEVRAKGFLASVKSSLLRTYETTFKTLESFKKLVTNEVSFSNVGGPLAIGKVASDSFNTSLSYFFQLMALISINLGVINLFPVPVLDGGHILFIFLELINRGPVSRRKMEIAQQFGLTLLLLLMIGAIFNDFSRFFQGP